MLDNTIMAPILQPGDVFVVRGNMGPLSALIRAVDWFWGRDNEARYGHAGIIIDADGSTVEALSTVRRGNISAYAGQDIYIARPTNRIDGYGGQISRPAKITAIKRIEAEFLGRCYPWWRVPLNIIYPLAKLITDKKHLVCSELVAYYLYLIGARQEPYTGVHPGVLADEWHRWRNFSDVFEGKGKGQ